MRSNAWLLISWIHLGAFYDPYHTSRGPDPEIQNSGGLRTMGTMANNSIPHNVISYNATLSALQDLSTSRESSCRVEGSG